MVDLDSIRIADMQAKCSHSGCSSNTLDTGLSSQAQLEKPDNGTSTPQKNDQYGKPNQFKDDQELGWSKVGSRKKNKKKYK